MKTYQHHIFNDSCPSFEIMWKEELNTFPEVPYVFGDWKAQEGFKQFAKKVYETVITRQDIRKMIEDAYETGYEDGARKGRIETISSVVSTIKEQLDKL